MATKSRAARSKRTKDELISELEELEAKVKNAERPDPIAESVARSNIAKTREAVKGFSVDTIVSAGAQFGLNVQRTVASLTEQAVQKAEELKQLQDAVEIETAELERLYGLDVASASIQALITEHEEKKAELEKEIAAARQAWTEEVAAHTKAVAQRNAETEASRRREAQEYDYATRQARERAEEAFKYKLQIAERDQQERKAQAEKEINERLAELARQENALAEGRARIEGLDAEVKQRVDREVAIATNSVKKELTNQFTLEKKELETQLQLSKQATITSEQNVARLSQEIVKLQAQLEAARAEVRDIAKSAVEGASGQLALAKVMEVRQENGQSLRKS